MMTTSPAKEALSRVRITEVAARDGLQNEKGWVPTQQKIEFIDRLSRAAFPEIEATSFVSKNWVPQLGDAAEVMSGIKRNPATIYSALVPNERGFDAALAARVDKVAVFAAASEGFSRANTNGSIEEVLARLARVIARAREASLPVRGYISCAVRCPIDGPTSPAAVRSVAQRLLDLGVNEIDLGDTIGAARPDDIDRLFDGLVGCLSPADATLHLHDTSGVAVSCALRALTLGVRSFDASAGGLGGCPYAPGAPGNVATESLVEALENAGFSTGIDLGRVRAAGQWMRQELARVGPASS